VAHFPHQEVVFEK